MKPSPSETEPATFRLVAQSLNQLRHDLTLTFRRTERISVKFASECANWKLMSEFYLCQFPSLTLRT